MKRINRKKLNNKGFTLIELLAVVVILAVVMGIAMTSVLSSMNNSRKGSLENSATSVAQAFQTKYSESMVTQSMSKVYGDVMGLTDGVGYNFGTASTSAPVFYYLNKALKDELNLSPSTYILDPATTITTVPKVEGGTNYAPVSSFVAFNGKSVVVCLLAKNSGSYYVADFAEARNDVAILGQKVNFTNVDSAAPMWSCSLDGVNSWTPAS